MPKGFLTQEQKLAQRYANLRECIGKRVEWTMSGRRLSQKNLAKELGMGHGTIKKIREGEDVMLSTTDWLRILDIAGLKLVDRRQDEIAKEGNS